MADAGYINALLEGVRMHTERQLKQKSLAIDQQRANAQTEAEQARIQHDKDQLAETKRQFDAQLELTAKAAKLVHIQKTQEITGEIAKSGMLPPGATASPAASSVPGGAVNYTPMNPQAATSQIVQLPGVQGTSEIPTMEALAARQAGAAEIAAAPGRKTEALKQQAETDRQIKVETARAAEETKRFLAQIDKTTAAQKEMKQMEIAGENHRNSITSGTQMKIAQLPYTWFNNLPEGQRAATMQPHIEALTNGTMSGAQVQKDFAEKGMAGAGAAVLGAFMSSGGVPLTQKQVDFNGQVKPIIDNLPVIAQYIQALPKSSTGFGGLVAGATHPDILNPGLESKMKQIEFQIATVAKTLGGDAGQRLQKALLAPAEGGYLPNKYKSTEFNVENYNKLVQVVNQAIDTQLGSVPVGQRAHIKSTLGLTKIPLLKPDGTPLEEAAPAQGPAVQGGATHVWTPQGIVPAGGR